jgi:hypothetical protein
MNLIEAVKSGKPLKRKGWTGYLKSDEIATQMIYKSDILADDWEIEEKKVTITRDQLFVAYKNANASSPTYTGLAEGLAKELGL